MGNRLIVSVVLASTLSLQTGCSLFESSREFTRQSLRAFKPRPTDYRDFTEEEDDEWGFVGKEARGHRELEKDPDPWFKKYFMSEKARNIDRNLGFE